MFAQEPPPDFDISCRREPGERPELMAEVGLVEVACATGEVGPVDRFGEEGRFPWESECDLAFATRQPLHGPPPV
jgi:hypothetical protein